MAYLKLLVLACVAIGLVFGQGDIVKVEVLDKKHTTTTVKPTTSTTNTTPKPTTTSVVPPNITTTATTTTAKPTPTPTPAPAPVEPVVGNWTVDYDKSNRTCIVAEVAIQFEILESSSNKTMKMNVPGDAIATGSCEVKDKQYLKLAWGNNNTLEFDFAKTNSSKFELNDIMSSVNVTLPGAGPKVYSLIHQKSEFSTPLEKSYKCARLQTLNLTESTNTNVTVAYLHISHVQFQAFRNTTGTGFDSAMDCDGSVTPDIVPIVVGCVLAALVVMVLIAYLVGRRRCQARGYLSM